MMKVGFLMAQLVVRYLEEDVKVGLKRRAERHGRSMGDEVRGILRDTVKTKIAKPRDWGRGSRAVSRRGGLISTFPNFGVSNGRRMGRAKRNPSIR
jgi:hypothetical protein